MQLSENAYYWSRFLFERKHQYLDALTYLSEELGSKANTLAFFEISPTTFSSTDQPQNGGGFTDSISYHLCHVTRSGFADALNLPYGMVFSALWTLYPDTCWLHNLLIKDFSHGSFLGRYLDAPEELENWTVGMEALIKTLQDSIATGELVLSSEKLIPFGAIVFEQDWLDIVPDNQWYGLKEALRESFSNIGIPSNLRTIEGFWEAQLSHRPARVLEKGFDYLFHHSLGREAAFASLKYLDPFVQRFAVVLKKSLATELHTSLWYYAGLPEQPSSNLWLENLVKVARNKMTSADFLAEFDALF